jgi:hypothetical protein
MQANELRIGNYLKGQEWSVPRLQMYSNGIAMITGHGIDLIERGLITDLQPIPLNHFWFKEFQFERHHKDGKNGGLEYLYIKHFKHEGKPFKFEVFSDENGSFFSMYQHPKNNLEKKMYVHQLQNIYFEFTNQELKRDF